MKQVDTKHIIHNYLNTDILSLHLLIFFQRHQLAPCEHREAGAHAHALIVLVLHVMAQPLPGEYDLQQLHLALGESPVGEVAVPERARRVVASTASPSCGRCCPCCRGWRIP